MEGRSEELCECAVSGGLRECGGCVRLGRCVEKGGYLAGYATGGLVNASGNIR